MYLIYRMRRGVRDYKTAWGWSRRINEAMDHSWFDAHIIRDRRRNSFRCDVLRFSEWYVERRVPLDDTTANALSKFIIAMNFRLSSEENNYGTGWTRMTSEELRDSMHNMIAVGNPIDVAAFCLFLHARGFSTKEED